jgi:hypothetical protein
MIHTGERGTEAWWTETGAEEWADAIAKAHAKGRPAPRLVTMTHEHVALNAALGNAMARNQPAATAVTSMSAPCTTAPPSTPPGAAAIPCS